MHWIDWSVVIVLVLLLTSVATFTRGYMQSVADFLAANRCAGRYMLTIGEGMAGLGAITILGQFEIYNRAGFVPAWWSLMMSPIGFIIALSGWIIFRFRQTKAFTMAQFFEMRYSRNFRIFTGILAFVAGILNFGIFPSVGARFFLYFCRFPQYYRVFGIDVSTYATVMFILLLTALYFTFSGGQITVLITDFLQGMLCNFAFIAIIILVLTIFDWSQIITAMTDVPEQSSLVNPFKTGDVKDFNVWYYLIAAFGAFYMHMSWQGNQGHNCCALSPHEARMGRILGGVRFQSFWLMMCILPIGAYTLMQSSDYSLQSNAVRNILNSIANPQIREQMYVPLAVKEFLPIGFQGMFCAVVLAAFISTHDTYLHSFGSIFIQDVVIPLRGKHFSPKAHILALRLSIIFVAVFVFFFSLWFKHTENIVLYLAITGAIFTGGSGAVIIGGLYWKKGTTSAAWASMLIGSTIAVSSIVIRQIYPDFPINSQVMWFISMISSTLIYITVSIFGQGEQCDMDKLLNRSEKSADAQIRKPTIPQRLGITDEFTKGDKAIYYGSISWIAVWMVIFVFGVIYNLIVDVPDSSWAIYWKINVYLTLILAIFTSFWLTTGGISDAIKMFRKLSSAKQDNNDDGVVEK